MRNSLLAVLCLSLLACSTGRKQELATIGSIQTRTINLEEPEGALSVDEDKARKYYQEFLSITTDYQMYSQALRRLADLQLKIGETQLSGEDAKSIEAGQRETEASIRLYTTYLETHPNHPNNDQILYQLAKAYELNGQPDKSLEILDRIMHFYPATKHRDEVQFRRGEMLFLLRRYQASEQAYQDIITNNQQSIFYEKALYKYGWTRFKTNRYRAALDPFFIIMDRKQQQGMLQMDRPVDDLVGTERELIVDTLRAISLSFAYLYGDYSITDYFNENGNRPYEPIIYLSLGQLHFEKERVKDAADTYMAYVQRYPASPLAPEFHTEAINVYQKGGLTTLVLPAKEEFVKLYGVGSAYWVQQDEAARNRIKPLLATHITEIATHYHAQARKSKQSPDYYKAATWYAQYLKNFPNDTQSANMNFLMAEALYDGRYYVEAAAEYEKAAYHYPLHGKSAEAGYAALLSYTAVQQTQPERYATLRQQAISSALRFGETFPADPRVPAVLTKLADELFQTNDYLRAASVAQQLVKRNIQDPKLARTVWIILGHSEFELKNYAQAEAAYRQSLNYVNNKDKQYPQIYDRLAASIYKQGEIEREAGNFGAAVAHFLRVAQVTPASSIRASADFDAATSLISMKQYDRASQLLEEFRRSYPAHPLNKNINEKLALIYSETGQSGRAAREMELLARNNRTDRQYSANLLWQAATYYEKADMHKDAQRVYAQYVRENPQPLERAMEGRHRLAEYARKSGDGKAWGTWLQEIIRADAGGGAQRTERTRYLAADATLKLADGHRNVYQRAALTQPLKASLQRKKDLLQTSIRAYETAIQYRVADVTTAATYQIGEMYYDFSRALLKSDPPAGLSAEAVEQYKILLEDQAFPLEEKAIDIHAANLRQIREGIYDQWVKGSLERLRKMLPVRYAKDEKLEAYVESIH